MLNNLIEQFKALPLNEKWLLGVSAVIIGNYQLAYLFALLTLAFYIYKIFWPVIKKELDKQA